MDIFFKDFVTKINFYNEIIRKTPDSDKKNIANVNLFEDTIKSCKFDPNATNDLLNDIKIQEKLKTNDPRLNDINLYTKQQSDNCSKILQLFNFNKDETTLHNLNNMYKSKKTKLNLMVILAFDIFYYNFEKKHIFDSNFKKTDTPEYKATYSVPNIMVSGLKAIDKLPRGANFFTLLIFYASYDFSIDAPIVNKFIANKFDIKPFMLFSNDEFELYKKVHILDPYVFDLSNESLQLFHVGSIETEWDYANGKLTILLYNMLQDSSYKELFNTRYISNKLFLFDCINAIKQYRASIIQLSISIQYPLSTLKAIEILLIKLSYILNELDNKFLI